MKKTVEIQLDAGTSHSNTIKMKEVQEHEKCISSSEDSNTEMISIEKRTWLHSKNVAK